MFVCDDAAVCAALWFALEVLAPRGDQESTGTWSSLVLLAMAVSPLMAGAFDHLMY